MFVFSFFVMIFVDGWGIILCTLDVVDYFGVGKGFGRVLMYQKLSLVEIQRIEVFYRVFCYFFKTGCCYILLDI